MSSDGVVPINPDSPIGEHLGEDVTPVLWGPGVALDKIRKRARQLAHVVGQPVPSEGPLDGLQAVEGGYRKPYSYGTFYIKGSRGTPFWLDNPTALRYDLRGNSSSYLGFPVADLEVDESDPTMGLTRFEHGAIYFFRDLGMIDVQHVAVTYEGFHCFGETDEPSEHDEPFFTFGVVPIDTEQRAAVQTRIYTEVDGGDSVQDKMELYKGVPLGLGISVILVEHDYTDPEYFKDKVDQAVDKAAEKVVEGLAQVPVVGWALSVIADVAFLIGGEDLKREVNELVGTADDHIATEAITLSTRELLRLTQTPPTRFEGVLAHLETPLMTDGDASYKAYFRVEAVTPT